jgi:hypothetical protein
MCTTTIYWTITPTRPPEPVLPCSTCGAQKPFHSSGKTRLNANGKKLDAWLIYKCDDCDKTWNCPLFERRAVGDIAAETLTALLSNDPNWIRQQEFNHGRLRRFTHHIAEFGDYEISKSEDVRTTPCRIEIILTLPVALRLDRLLAIELNVSRSKLAEMFQRGTLGITPDQKKSVLSRNVRNGTVVNLR